MGSPGLPGDEAVGPFNRSLRVAGEFGCDARSRIREHYWASTLPWNNTGPVGNPVGEPPCGSRLTASTVPAPPTAVAGSVSGLPGVAESRPRGLGLPAAIAHSSKLF